MKDRTFKGQYEALPPTERTRIDLMIMERCNVELYTIHYRWTQKPPKRKNRLVLSEIFNTPENILFPDSKTN